MRLKRVGRFGTVGGLVAAALGSSIVFTPSSASADSGWWCYGTQVERCATVWWDQTTDTFEARAMITDVAGGGSFEVTVTDVQLQRTDGSNPGYVTLRSTDDHDGWHDTEDSAATSAVDPCNFPRQSYSVVATFRWRGADSGEKTWRPDTVWGHLCD